MERIDAEADALIRDLGDQAYQEARRREHEASSESIAEDWALVARAVARKTGSRVGLNLTTQLEMNTFFVLDREPGVAREARPRPDPEVAQAPIREPKPAAVAAPQPAPRLSQRRSPRLSRFGSSLWARPPSPDQPYCGRTRSGPPTSPPRSSPPRSPPGRPKRSACAFSITTGTRFSADRSPPADRGCRDAGPRWNRRVEVSELVSPKLKRASAANWTKPASHIGRLAASGSERRVMMIFLKVHFGLFLPGFRLSFGSAQRKIPGFLLELGE